MQWGCAYLVCCCHSYLSWITSKCWRLLQVPSHGHLRSRPRSSPPLRDYCHNLRCNVVHSHNHQIKRRGSLSSTLSIIKISTPRQHQSHHHDQTQTSDLVLCTVQSWQVCRGRGWESDGILNRKRSWKTNSADKELSNYTRSCHLIPITFWEMREENTVCRDAVRWHASYLQLPYFYSISKKIVAS